jgi:hypothetical protein
MMHKTYDLVLRNFWWPSIRTLVKKHCETCDSCQRVRQNNQKAAGLYQALPIPLTQWHSISVDLITQLPPTKNGNTCIVVFVDKLTKMIHVVLTGSKYSATILADNFLQNVFRLHGMPSFFISEIDCKFNSSFWKNFFQACYKTINLSTSYQPQTDGQTEVVNK